MTPDPLTQVAADEESVQMFQHAMALEDLGRYEEALAAALDVLRLQPDFYPAHCMIASCLYALGDVEGTHQALKSVLGMNPADHWAVRLLSLNLKRMNRLDEALRAARESVRLEPEDFLSQAVLSEAARALKRYKEAEGAASEAVHLAPEQPEGYYCLAQIALSQRKYSKAEKLFRQALQVDPQHYPSMNDLGVALQNQLGKTKEAMNVLQQAAQLAPSAPLARSNLYAGARKYVYGGGMLAAWFVWMALSRLVGEADPEMRKYGIYFLILTVAVAAPAGLFAIVRRRKKLSMPAKLVIEAGPEPAGKGRPEWAQGLGMVVAGVVVLAILGFGRAFISSLDVETGRAIIHWIVYLALIALPWFFVYKFVRRIRRR